MELDDELDEELDEALDEESLDDELDFSEELVDSEELLAEPLLDVFVDSRLSVR
ncbi:hypothetical protein MMON_00720 [Mycolicibacterium monacense]|uniref:Uncharacterized protein n=1 Tax=Mycolicibacterium monacense TaxID=85693 RepID=A0AAD1IUQ0_MYCMB|nr:hypothetical protein [Mycolicibacterium monacense DSM 44395]BBZ58771.1 hypothetical protein MMON_00720 [Mycolicibacterium monacense]